ncbi:MAG: hypothetical protein ACREPR_11320 [Brasilonema sp.]
MNRWAIAQYGSINGSRHPRMVRGNRLNGTAAYTLRGTPDRRSRAAGIGPIA